MAHRRPDVKNGPEDETGGKNMALVKKIVLGVCLTLAVAWALGRADGAVAEPATPPVAPVQSPARADLAEAVLTMLVARAAKAGLPQPLTLCEACAAAHLGLPEVEIRENCARACGLR
jgi:hypothetical protein